jgi:acetyl-CoA carboxylase biotin carboxyl carrier protein
LHHEVRTEIVGTLIRFSVREGDRVSVGDEIAVLESMKMEIPIEAPTAGRIDQLCATTGNVVDEGAVIAIIDSN